MSEEFDLSKLLNMVLSGLGVIALVYIIVKIFRLDRFVPPSLTEIPFFSESKASANMTPAILSQVQSQPQPEQTQVKAIETPQAYGDYYYTDLYENIPNIPQLPEPSVSHNKAGNKTQVEDLPFVRSDYNTGQDLAEEKEPFFDESTVVTGMKPLARPYASSSKKKYQK